MPKPIPASLAHLPVSRGLPVPWVTVWAAEQEPRLISIRHDRTGRILEARASGTVRLHGMYFINLGNARMGRGEPDFGATSSSRQRSCMTRPRCQVCGRRIDGVPHWLIPKTRGWIEEEGAGARWTKQPPVCATCATLAPEWCPALRRDGYDHMTGTATVVGATGSALQNGRWVDVWTTLESDDRTHVLGRDFIVQLEIHEVLGVAA